MKLHGFFRSGSSHRLRIALNLKGLTYEYIAVNLRSEEHLSARYRTLNPQGFVPTLEADGQVLIQSPSRERAALQGGRLTLAAYQHRRRGLQRARRFPCCRTGAAAGRGYIESEGCFQ